MKKEKNKQSATKADVEEVVGELAHMTAKEFLNVHKRIDTVSDTLESLNEKVDMGFEETRKEVQDGFRVVLAAIETVEYTKLRMRIDVLEHDMAKVKERMR